MANRARSLWVGLIVVLLMLVFVWKGWRARTLAARVDLLRTEQRVLTDEQDRLQTVATSLSNVDRIKSIAREKLGLVDPPTAPVDVPAVAPLAVDSLDAARATGTETLRSGAKVSAGKQAR